MLHKRFLIVLSLLLLTSACQWNNAPEEIVRTEYIRQNIEPVARPSGVQLNDVRWYIVTSENLEEFLANFEDDAIVVLSVRDYENLSLNVAELRRYIEQQQQVIIYYENAIQ